MEADEDGGRGGEDGGHDCDGHRDDDRDDDEEGLGDDEDGGIGGGYSSVHHIQVPDLSEWIANLGSGLAGADPSLVGAEQVMIPSLIS